MAEVVGGGAGGLEEEEGDEGDEEEGHQVGDQVVVPQLHVLQVHALEEVRESPAPAVVVVVGVAVGGGHGGPAGIGGCAKLRGGLNRGVRGGELPGGGFGNRDVPRRFLAGVSPFRVAVVI